MPTNDFELTVPDLYCVLYLVLCALGFHVSKNLTSPSSQYDILNPALGLLHYTLCSIFGSVRHQVFLVSKHPRRNVVQQVSKTFWILPVGYHITHCVLYLALCDTRFFLSVSTRGETSCNKSVRRFESCPWGITLHIVFYIWLCEMFGSSQHKAQVTCFSLFLSPPYWHRPKYRSCKLFELQL